MLTSQGVGAAEARLRDLGGRHLWTHFGRLEDPDAPPAPIMVRGRGCYVWDVAGRRYLDALSALYCVNIGHGREDVVEAGARAARELAFFPIWSSAHPAAIELAARVAGIAPPGLERVFLTSGGSDAVDSAIKLARQHHVLRGNPRKTKIIARDVAYHGSTYGALTATGVESYREPFAPLVPGGCHVANTDTYRLAAGELVESLGDAVGDRIDEEGASTVAAVILEPVQNAGGCLVPPPGYFQRVRAICDAADVLLISDEVICGWGRLGHWFGADRYGFVPDIITTAKGITSGYAPMGAVIASERVAIPFLEPGASFVHGFTFGGHPLCAAVALANIDALDSEGLLAHVLEQEQAFRGMLDTLRDIPIVGDVRGAGFFQALELVKDGATKQRLSAAEADWLVRRFLPAELRARGLICRCDRRGEPVLQLAPPLIAGPEEFQAIHDVLRPLLLLASRRLRR